MTDHPLLIPTSQGPVGGIVSEPETERRAALMIMVGLGRPARSGINAFWTRLSRELSALGVVVLRTDNSREGETLPLGEGVGGQGPRRELELRLLGEIMPWFQERTEGLPLLLAGACSGARFSIELAGAAPESVAGSFLIVPHLLPPNDPAAGGAGSAVDETVDQVVVDCLEKSLASAPSRLLVGERDSPDVAQLVRRLPPTTHRLEVEVVPGIALHFLDQPDCQGEAGRWLLARIAQAIAAV